jgi:anti-sigma regulatory factor (Ser/Thr protein kinase)
VQPAPHVSLRLARGPQAPGQARAAVLDRFGERLGASQAYDVALAVTELVANSVREPAPGSADEVGLEVGMEGDHLLIEVRDRGARVAPRGTPGAKRLGLLIVDRLAGSWGVTRDSSGRARVWAELPLDPIDTPQRPAR